MKDVKINLYKIIEKTVVTHDTSRFVFELPEGTPFDFLPGDHLKIYPDKNNRLEFRPYTPTSTPDDSGFFELIIKHYPDGKVSGYMRDRAVGDEIAMSGPNIGRHFTDGMAARIGMVAGGTGITPIISMIRTIIRRSLDVEISLLFANKTTNDIILKDELDKYALENSNFNRYYILNDPPDGWEMGTGRIDPDLMKEKLPEPSAETLIFLCGPPRMQLDLRKKLLELGYEKETLLIP
ncbi:MAG: NADH-cytochrome b5 reductase [candidate division Zixibacteria bacterium]